MKLFVGVCGSIAAYRSVDFLRALKSQGHHLKVVLTHSAEEFVSRTVLDTFLQDSMISNQVFDETHSGTDHIAVAKWADSVIVYGATAHFLAQYRAGLAGDFLLTQLLAFEGQVYLMPAMNPSMWSHPSTQENVKTLKERGIRFLGPIAGRVACGDEGVGHLVSHEEALSHFAKGHSLPSQTKVLVSMGPMRSSLDPVRFMQNHSSGLMGLELVRALVEKGISPQVLVGPVDSQVLLSLKDLVSESFIFRYEQPRDYGENLLRLSQNCDVFYSAAAVLDFEFEVLKEKLDRREEKFFEKLKTKPVRDFAKQFGESKSSHQVMVSFSAEVANDDQTLLKRALEKKKSKFADWTLVNRVSASSGPLKESSEAWIIDPSNHVEFLGKQKAKKVLAQILVDRLHSS